MGRPPGAERLKFGPVKGSAGLAYFSDPRHQADCSPRAGSPETLANVPPSTLWTRCSIRVYGGSINRRWRA